MGHKQQPYPSGVADLLHWFHVDAIPLPKDSPKHSELQALPHAKTIEINRFITIL